MSLRRRASLALVALIAMTPALVAVQSASAANVAPFVGTTYSAQPWADQQLGAMSVGVPYSDSISRGTATESWELRSTLPAGLSGTASGDQYLITGTPTAPGDVTFTIASFIAGEFDQIVFDVTVVDSPSAALRGDIELGSGTHAAPYAPGEVFSAGFEYVNDSDTVVALYPTMVITFAPGVTNLGGVSQGSWECFGTQTVTCTAPLVSPGLGGVAYIANVWADPDYAKSTFTITNTVSATNSAASPYALTVPVTLPAPTASVAGPMPYSNVTLTGYAPGGSTSGTISFALSSGAVLQSVVATVGADGVATYTGAISSDFSGKNVQVSPVYDDGHGATVQPTSSATFYAFQQRGVAGHFYLNGALYTDPVKLYLYADTGYPYLAYQRDNLTGGSYSITPGGGVPYGYYMWAELGGQSSQTTYYNSAGEYAPSVDDRTTVGPHNFTNSMNFYWEAAPTFTETGMAVPRQNVAFSDGVTATSNVGLVYSVSTGTLPTGLLLNAADGSIFGTPSVLGQDYSFVVSVKNLTNSRTSYTPTISGTVLPEHILPTWVDETLGDFRLNQTVTDAVAATGDPTIVYEVSDGDLPTGVTLDPQTGQLGGAPTALGENYEFELRASNDWGDVYADFSGEVLAALAAPVWTDNTLGELRVGETRTDGVTASGVPAPVYTSADLPTWASLNASTGAISATPLATGAYDFTVKAENSEGSITQRFTGTVQPAWIAPSFTDDTIVQLQGGVYLDDQVLATGDGPITYSVPLGELPFWLTLDPMSGLISGTAPLAMVGEPYSFTVTATSAHGFDTAALAGVVAAAPSTALQLGFAVGDTAAGASFGYSVSGADAEVPFSVTVNSTPVVVASGLTSALGAASGSATIPAGIAAGSHSIVLLTSATDGTPRTTTVWFTVLRNGTIGAISLLGPLAYNEAAALASTGLDVTPLVAVALLLLALGATLRRRRRA